MSNIEQLIESGVIPADYAENLSESELYAISSLSEDEVKFMISGALKLGPEFFEKHCPHGIYF